MRINVDTSVLREARWYDYGLRFLFGGLITAATGLIAKRFGAAIGGLFLAFPAILPASVTLIEKHEEKKKKERGMHGFVRGRKAAAVDAAGATLGSFGLLAFAWLAWQFFRDEKSWLALACATVAWAGVSVVAWLVRKRI
ncbi:MAG: DUF3147 family protein [Terriglobales bacterium]